MPEVNGNDLGSQIVPASDTGDQIYRMSKTSKLHLTLAKTQCWTAEESDNSSESSEPFTEDELQDLNGKKVPLAKKMSSSSYGSTGDFEPETSIGSDGSHSSPDDAETSSELEDGIRKLFMGPSVVNILDKMEKLRLSPSNPVNHFENQENPVNHFEERAPGKFANPVHSNVLTLKMNIIEGRSQEDQYLSSEDGSSSSENEDAADDSDLIERGPVKHPSHPSRGKPYDPMQQNRSSTTSDPNTSDLYIETFVKIISNDTNHMCMINSCLAELSKPNADVRQPLRYENMERPICNNQRPTTNAGSSPLQTLPPESSINIPTIVLNNNDDKYDADFVEAMLLKGLKQGVYQKAPEVADNTSRPISSPAQMTECMDSPSSSYNVYSRPSSRSSSVAPSPMSSVNLESPVLVNATSSPVGSPPNPYACWNPPPLSSSSSSNQSYSNFHSPANYGASVDPQTEEMLKQTLENVGTWSDHNNEPFVDLNRALQVVKDQSDFSEQIQAVPDFMRLSAHFREQDQNSAKGYAPLQDDQFNENLNLGYNNIFENNFPNMEATTVQNSLSMDKLSQTASVQNYLDHTTFEQYSSTDVGGILEASLFPGKDTSTYDQTCIGYENPMRNFSPTITSDPVSIQDHVTMSNHECISSERQNVVQSVIYNRGSTQTVSDLKRFQNCSDLIEVSTENGGNIDYAGPQQNNETCSTSMIQNPFDNFQIPQPVHELPDSRLQIRRRDTMRRILPKPSLILPSTPACQRLMDKLSQKPLRQAMQKVLKMSPEELAKQDEDGDTRLMCLVGNQEELEKNLHYLIPLVERLKTIVESLSVTNNQGEDALYLAAMNCPGIACVTGYLAATMLERGIDITQTMYNNRGDTLMHAVARKGDSHRDVLAELLRLKTAQDIVAFDLSKCNYDGYTSLHVAVESHGESHPTRQQVSTIGTVQLLLKHGADPKIRETKCGSTALHMAIRLNCDPALVEALLYNHGKQAVHLKDNDSNTPMHLAAAATYIPLERQMKICHYLIQAGGTINVQNRQGKMPLALVAQERKEVIMQILHKKMGR